MKVQVERTSPIDVATLASAFAARDRAGDSLGVLSPLSETTVTLGAATLRVEYSRPSRGGRGIYGDFIPWGEVWRTGANARPSTDVDLRIGDQSLAAGRYTLWTVFAPDSATLIINAQTDQWGTQHDSSPDVSRIPQRRQGAEPEVEQFTSSVLTDGVGREDWCSTGVRIDTGRRWASSDKTSTHCLGGWFAASARAVAACAVVETTGPSPAHGQPT